MSGDGKLELDDLLQFSPNELSNKIKDRLEESWNRKCEELLQVSRPDLSQKEVKSMLAMLDEYGPVGLILLGMLLFGASLGGVYVPIVTGKLT